MHADGDLAMDGAFLTHSQHMVKIPSPGGGEAVPARSTTWATCCSTPTTRSPIAPQVNEDWVMEIRRQNGEAARRARGVIEEAYKIQRRSSASATRTPTSRSS